MMVDCRKCGRRRSAQFMVEAVFPTSPHEGAGVYRCSSNESCKNARKRCAKCGHNWYYHERDGGQEPDSCQYGMGMGNACECKGRIPYKRDKND